jgi:hypothetical protein
MGGQVHVRLGTLGGWCYALVQGRAYVRTDTRALEAQWRDLESRPTSRGLQQTLVPSLAHWSIKDTLLWLVLRTIWGHLRPALWSYALIHLPCIGGNIVVVLVLLWMGVGG